MLKIECYPLGELQANCYFVYDEQNDVSLLVDPGAESEILQNKIEKFGSEKLQYILLTHGHFDHIGNAAHLKRKYPDVKIVIGENDSEFTTNDSLNLSVFFGDTADHFNADILVNDASELVFGENKIYVIATPGHTRGGVCYRLGDNLFTGDTIMSRTTGRMDFPTGNSREMYDSVQKIASIKKNLNLFCGHGASTTLDYEKTHNIAMGNIKCDDLY